ncbi:uncharacterized protein MELLADRAFT_107194 [Melampsora larici-populina 98AG31]|uniref:RNI-like protein n=1 Tax=Melampsora larici-populina (strain 98AG31 / pathotype 3-4-7) TaxID=747676 RepID=F4RP52_MELLP|nr:uncharacterized protein MELLADRAFT_107194 [Melampsora larici-populina 98AG31]EGG05912.1 hypothetical protein MELLADRAFT_107194 [Melampsora larici-populina 98AG31]
MPPKKRSIKAFSINGYGPIASKRTRLALQDSSGRLATAEHQLESGVNHLSTRPYPSKPHAIPRLTSLCLLTIAQSFQELFLDKKTGQKTYECDANIELIKKLPTHLLQRLFHLVTQPSVPSFVPKNIINLFFGTNITEFICNAVKIPREFVTELRTCIHLTTINLSKQTDLDGKSLAKSLRELTNLQHLNLSGCVKLGDEVVKAVAETSEDRMQYINLNLTAVTTDGLSVLLGRCPNLETLKLSNVNSLKDKEIFKLIDKATELANETRHIPLSKLKNLKLKSTLVSATGLGRFLNLCAPTLERLDISYTKVEALDVLRMALFRVDSSLGTSSLPSLALSPCKLTKLVISGLSILSWSHSTAHSSGPIDSLVDFFDTFASQPEEIRNRFHTLKMGFMGNPPPPNGFTIPLDDLLALDSARLNKLIPSIYKLEGLRNIYLRGNIDLAKNSMYSNNKDPLARFIRLIGRRCFELDLSDVTRLGNNTLNLGLNPFSEDSASIEDSDDESQIQEDSISSPRLTTLILNKTDVSDESKLAIATCTALESLFLQDTKITSEGLKFIIQNCPNLGVPRPHRRDFFST